MDITLADIGEMPQADHIDALSLWVRCFHTYTPACYQSNSVLMRAEAAYRCMKRLQLALANAMCRCLARCDATFHLCCWLLQVAALINPIPALNLAPDVRPAALCAASSEQRLRTVCEAMEQSIAFLERS